MQWREKRSCIVMWLMLVLVFTPATMPQIVLARQAQALAARPGQPATVAASAWTALLAQVKQARYQMHRAAGEVQAANPAQGWQMHFNGRGVTFSPTNGRWQWGLQLQSYGYAGTEHRVDHPQQMTSQDNRLVYQWDGEFSEWFLNQASGVEHGFTLQTRPAGDRAQPLQLYLQVHGDLHARVQDGGQGLAFVDGAGTLQLTYDHLLVYDAQGRRLPAYFTITRPTAAQANQRTGQTAITVRLQIDDRQARYPLTIDPVVQQAYLKASNTEAFDHFGTAVALSGDTLVVGASGEDSISTGVNGDQTNNLGQDSGAAYVFVRTSNGWSQQAYLKASDNAKIFGAAVAIDGDTIVVGAPLNAGGGWGAAYVFVRSNGVWSQQALLTASNAGVASQFGTTVAISSDTIVVGTPYESSSSTGINGNQNNSNAQNAGAAYVFARNNNTWSQQAYLKASNTEAFDFFGNAVAVSGDTVVVGAPGEDSNSLGVNGDQTNNNTNNIGAAYVFVRNNNTWSQQAYLKASTFVGKFGSALAASSDTIGVGAPFESPGAAYVFIRNNGVWSQQAELQATNRQLGDLFGMAVALNGNNLIVGAPQEDSNSTGINGEQTNNAAADAGAAYLFQRNGNLWSQQAYLKASNTALGDFFGSAVASSGNTLVVGAPNEDSNSVGINGDQTNNAAADAGAAYAFAILPPPVITIKLDSQPKVATNIVYTGTLGSFVLDDPAVDDGDDYANAKNFTVAPGSYQITQRVSSGWFLTAITCDTSGKIITDLTNKRVTINVVNGDHVTCTFVHKAGVKITARVFNDLVRRGSAFGVKNSGDPYLANWQIAVYRRSLIASKLTQISLPALTPQAVFTGLRPDVAYTVCATLQPGWTNSLPVLNATYHQPCTTLTLAAGQGATLNFGVYQPALLSAATAEDGGIDAVDEIYDLPVDELETDSAPDQPADAETVDTSMLLQRLFLPLIQNGE